LALSKILDEELNELSAKGNQAPLIFVDVRDFSDAYKLSGLYAQTQEGISLRMKIKSTTEEKKIIIKAASKEELMEKIIREVEKIINCD
jgi:hypothetical protein